MSSITLRELDNMMVEAIKEAENLVDEDGVIDDNWAFFLDELKIERDKKLLNCGRYIQCQEAEIEKVKNEINRLKKIKESLETKSESFKLYVSCNLQKDEKISDTITTLSFRKSDRVIVNDESIIPEQFKKVKIETSIDKNELKKAIKTGEIDEKAAKIETFYNLQIK